MISATVVCDSESPRGGQRITSLVVEFPRFIHPEVMTYGAFVRNAKSSRAVPITKTIQQVMHDPAMPSSWRKNAKGMQPKGNLTEDQGRLANALILNHRDQAVQLANELSELGLAKETVNRYLEPWIWSVMLITSTNWDNFFWQRCHPDAQEEMRLLAEAMRDAINQSIPVRRRLHVPFCPGDMPEPEINRQLTREGVSYTVNDTVRVAVANCARISYENHYGQKSVEDSVRLYNDLRKDGTPLKGEPYHASPFGHIAVADTDPHPGNSVKPRMWANFESWMPLRHLLGMF